VLGVAEDASDVVEQQVRQEAAAHDLAGLEYLREGQHLCGVQLDHPALGVLADDREEVEQARMFSWRSAVVHEGLG
jgi:hypothetical protein